MKKFLGILAIAGVLVACDNSGSETTATDSPSTTPMDTTTTAPITTPTDTTTLGGDTTGAGVDTTGR